MLNTIRENYEYIPIRASYILPAIELVRNATNEKIGKFTKREIMELVPSIGKESVENSLKKLADEGFLTRHGKGKGTFYTRN